MKAKTRLILLTPLFTTACHASPSAPPAAGAAVACTPEIAELRLRGGDIQPALHAFECGTSTTKAWASLYANQPERLLTEAARGQDVPWEALAIAAFQVGDTETMQRALVRQAQSTHAHRELTALAGLSSDMRAIRESTAQADASFDPSLGVPVIEVTVGGTTHRFIFDTGAEITVINSGLASALGVEARGTVRAETNAGSVERQIGTLDGLDVLGTSFDRVPVMISDIAAPPHLKIAGIIGVGDLFRKQVIRIDYRQGKVHRHARTSTNGAPMVFLSGRTVPGIGVRASDGGQGLFLVDTGGRRSTLTDAFVDQHRSSDAPGLQKKTTEVRALSVSQRERRFLPRVDLFPMKLSTAFELRDTPVDTTAADASTEQSGKLGADAFENRIIELDYVSMRFRVAS